MKRSHHDAGLEELDDAAKAARVAEHYGSRVNQSARQRKQSPIYALRVLNNWIKLNQFHAHVRPGDFVLDLACGKGGDLPKWQDAQIGLYVGVDIAEGSVRRDARQRYNERYTEAAGARHPFPAKLFVADAFAVRLDQPYPEGIGEYGPFDVVSCQFAFHYSFATEERARLALRNVARLLRPGGSFFGTTADANVLVKKLRQAEGLSFENSVFRVEFGEAHKSKLFPRQQGPFGLEYRFTLVDAVEDCAEYLVRPETFIALAREEGLELRKIQNFAKFVRDRLKEQWPRDLWAERGLGGLDNGSGYIPEPILSQDDWEASYLYSVFHFVKAGTPEAPEAVAKERRERIEHLRANGLIPKAGQPISEEEIGYLKPVPRELWGEPDLRKSAQPSRPAAVPPHQPQPRPGPPPAAQPAGHDHPRAGPSAGAPQQQPPAAASSLGRPQEQPGESAAGAEAGEGGAVAAPPTSALGWKKRKAAAAAGAEAGADAAGGGGECEMSFADADLF